MLLNKKILLKKYLLRRYATVYFIFKRPISQVKRYKYFASVISLVQAIKRLIYYYLFPNRYFVFAPYAYSFDKKKLIMLYSKDTFGFFFTLRIILNCSIKFFNKYKKLPEYIDNTHQFKQYKPHNKKNIDIAHEFFKETNINIKYTNPVIYVFYKNTPSGDIQLFIKKYFQPSTKVTKIIKNIEKKYQLNNYDNLCALYYRGTDKATETNLPTYEEVLEKAKTLKAKYPEIKFLLQSDEPDFLEVGLEYFPDATFFKDENIPRMPEPYRNFEHALNLLAIVIILSKCKYIICTTSNVSIWIMLYRGNIKNVMKYWSNKNRSDPWS